MAKGPPVADERLETLLKAWGQVYGDEYRDQPRRWRETAHHPIARAAQFAPGKRSKYRKDRAVVGRAGQARRLHLGANAGQFTKEGKPIPVQAYMVDPVRCAETRTPAAKIATRPVPPELQRIDQAIRDLESFSFLRALCVKVQFANHDQQQKDNVAKVNELMKRQVSRFHEGIELSRFRDELLYGKVWLHGRLLDDLNLARTA